MFRVIAATQEMSSNAAPSMISISPGLLFCLTERFAKRFQEPGRPTSRRSDSTSPAQCSVKLDMRSPLQSRTPARIPPLMGSLGFSHAQHGKGRLLAVLETPPLPHCPGVRCDARAHNVRTIERAAESLSAPAD